MNKIITLFCGGTGASGLIKELIKIKSIRLNIIVNAYDDGKSTGKIRDDFGILGPSDIVKNIINLLSPKADKNVKLFLEYRFSNFSIKKAFSDFELVIKGTYNQSEFGSIYKNLPSRLQNIFSKYLSEFYKHVNIFSKKSNAQYDLRDFALRNIIFTGAYLLKGKYQDTIDQLLIDLEIKNHRIVLNSDKNLFLVGLTENGQILKSEKDIVDKHIEEDINEVFLLDKKLSTQDLVKINSIKSIQKKINFLTQINKRPTLSTFAKTAIENAHLLIITPGTLESSLTPTFLTRNITHYFLSSSAKKIIIPNLSRERGKKIISEMLLRFEKIFRENGAPNVLVNQIFDYVIVNNHGYDTNNGNIKYIPIDTHRLEEMGLSIIENNLEKFNQKGKHNWAKVVEVLLRIKRSNKGNSDESITNSISLLKRSLTNPFIDLIDSERINNIVRSTTKKYSLVPKGEIKIVLPLAGLQKRFNDFGTKALFKINQKPALIHILEKTSKIDSSPLLIVNKANKEEVEKCIKEYKKGPHIFVSEPKGSAYALLKASHILKQYKYILVIWPDAPNIQVNTLIKIIRVNSIIHADVLIPTSWEVHPYAGILRDEKGNVVDIFQSNKTNISPKYGEHDGNAFLIKTYSLYSALDKFQKSKREVELDLNQAIKFMINEGKEIYAYCCSSNIETQGFNSKEEAQLVMRNYFKLLNKNKSLDLTIRIPKFNAKNKSQKISYSRVQKNYDKYLANEYKAIALDIDKNITKNNGEISSAILSKLLQLTKKNIFICFITARSEEYIKDFLIPKLIKLNKNIKLKNFYIYCDNGATGFNINNANYYFYKYEIPFYISDTAIFFIRKYIFTFNDDYKVSKSKITLFISTNKKYLPIFHKINYILKFLKLPLKAYIGEVDKYKTVIIISLADGILEINKGLALKDFSLRASIPINKIAKIADRGDNISADFSLLRSFGSFSTDSYDPKSVYQVPLSILSKRKNISAFKWLMQRIKFSF